MLPGQVQPHAARHQNGESRREGQELRQFAGRLANLFQIVEQEQELLSLQDLPQPFDQGRAWAFPNLQRPQDRRHDVLRALDRRKGDERHVPAIRPEAASELEG